MTATRERLEAAVAEGRMGERLWLYATYHCNLACVYCLTESAPGIANRRALTPEAMVAAVREARDLGLRCVGITGGEVFMLPTFPETLVEIAGILPTVALTNATLFTDRLLARLEPLADLDCSLQISLDSDSPTRNDEFRGPQNFAKAVAAIPRLLERGIRVRIATTVEYQTEEELRRVCELHRSLGVEDEDHVVRPIVRRGRAVDHGMGVDAGAADLPAELTITADGAFWSPFGPTVHGGRLDTDLLITRTTRPLSIPAAAMLRIAGAAGLQPASDGPRIR